MRIIVSNISSRRIDVIGITNLSLAEFDRSLSCHKGMFSNDVLTWLLKSFDKEDILSLLIGFLLTGTALLPIWPFLKYSATSPISVLCKFLISIAIFSRVAPKSDKWNTYSAYLSLGITCVVTFAAKSPSFFDTLSWTFTAFLPINEPVPTTPSVLQIRIRFFISSNLSRCVDISAAQFANLSPKEMILACCPWVLPTAGTFLYFIAFFARINDNLETFGWIILNASLICNELLVSTRSLLVKP